MASYLSEALCKFQDACNEYDASIGTAEEAAKEKHRLILYGIAALTLDAARADKGLAIPDPIVSERDQFVALAYMLRCAPAHDISVPVWKMNPRFHRPFTVSGITIDLSNVNGTPFDFKHIGGVGALFSIAGYAQSQGWA